MFQRTFLTGLAVTLLVVQACGSDDGNKRVPTGEAGMGGEAGSGDEPSSGGSDAIGGMPSEGGSGAATTAGQGGMSIVGEGGSGGEPPLPPDPEVLFTVELGAYGIPGTAIAEQDNAENFIFTSSSQSQDPVEGTNAVKIIGSELGLGPSDSIVSFTLLQPEPQDPVYAFSVTEGTEGASPNSVYHEYWNNDEQGDVFFSDATQTYRHGTEGGDQIGYNGLLMTERSLGVGYDGPEGYADNLRGLFLHDANQPITELYFTTNEAAVGLEGGTVEATPQAERGCTIFKSELDGTATVAFTCAELGLAPGDQIDSLLIYGDEAPSDVIFSVTGTSLGATGTAVDGVVMADTADGDPGATLFRSTGDESNTVHLVPRDLGLGYPYDSNYTYDVDDIDALAVVNGRAGSVAHVAACTVTFDPLDVDDGGLQSLNTGKSIGSSTLLLVGGIDGTARVLAYNANTCAFIDQQDLPAGFETGDWAIVPLTGWSAATPFANVEYLRAIYDSQDGEYEIHRYDTAGAFLSSATAPGLEYLPASIIYEPVNDLVYLLSDGNWGGPTLDLAVVARPTAASTSLEVERHNLSLPCSYNPRLNGTDQDGNFFVAQRQGTSGEYRVCGYTRYGALLPLPYEWTPQTPGEDLGFVLGRGQHYSYTSSDGLRIERGVYAP